MPWNPGCRGCGFGLERAILSVLLQYLINHRMTSSDLALNGLSFMYISLRERDGIYTIFNPVDLVRLYINATDPTFLPLQLLLSLDPPLLKSSLFHGGATALKVRSSK